jgi:translation initiation factor 2B subunit (eIF-2B alpha/beta/delta family)
MEPRQMPVEALHDFIQQESIKGPLEQERFNQQMEALRDLLRAANQSNINLEAIIRGIPLLSGLFGAT